MLKKANLDIIETSQELRTEHISLVVGVSSCFEGVFKKVLSTSPFFSNFKNSYSNLLFCETSSRGANKVIVKKRNSCCQDTCGKECYLLYLSKMVFYCCFPCLPISFNLSNRSWCYSIYKLIMNIKLSVILDKPFFCGEPL